PALVLVPVPRSRGPTILQPPPAALLGRSPPGSPVPAVLSHALPRGCRRGPTPVHPPGGGAVGADSRPPSGCVRSGVPPRPAALRTVRSGGGTPRLHRWRRDRCVAGSQPERA